MTRAHEWFHQWAPEWMCPPVCNLVDWYFLMAAILFTGYGLFEDRANAMLTRWAQRRRGPGPGT
jgi:hypothetical protein